MIEIVRTWYRRHFSDPQVVILAIFLLSAFAVVMLFGDILAPVLVAFMFAYLLEGVVGTMERHGIPRLLAVMIVLLVFVVFCVVVFFGLVPLLSMQVTQLIRELPRMIAAGQEALLRLPELYPALFTEKQIQELIDVVRSELGTVGQAILSVSLTHAINLLSFLVYVILVPLLVFFALKDKDKIVDWANKFLPRQRELSFQVWKEVDLKIANYVRGKFIEILIIWVVTYLTFALMGLNFSLLLSFLVGISVIVPFVGAIAVTIPIALIAYFQWGLSASFWYLLLAYQIIQVLDGNVLVPVLFSEVVNLHPIAIIVAVLFFGGIWGLWGVFFAIPLATVVQAVLNVWPPPKEDEQAI